VAAEAAVSAVFFDASVDWEQPARRRAETEASESAARGTRVRDMWSSRCRVAQR
jgi:hypothetical protein